MEHGRTLSRSPNTPTPYHDGMIRLEIWPRIADMRERERIEYSQTRNIEANIWGNESRMSHAYLGGVFGSP